MTRRHNSNKQRTSPKRFTSIVSIDAKYGEASLTLPIQLVFEVTTQTAGATSVERYAAVVQPKQQCYTMYLGTVLTLRSLMRTLRDSRESVIR